MVQTLSKEAIASRHQQLHQDWSVSDDQTVITREFKLDNFLQAMALANSVSWLAEKQDHHPDILVGYGKCAIRYTTHSCNGLTELDFKAAQAVDQLVS